MTDDNNNRLEDFISFALSSLRDTYGVYFRRRKQFPLDEENIPEITEWLVVLFDMTLKQFPDRLQASKIVGKEPDEALLELNNKYEYARGLCDIDVAFYEIVKRIENIVLIAAFKKSECDYLATPTLGYFAHNIKQKLEELSKS